MVIDDAVSFKIKDGAIQKVRIGWDRVPVPEGAAIDVKTIAINKIGDELSQTTGKEMVNFNNLIPLYGGSNTISLNELPVGAKVTSKNGKYYYNGKEVIQ